MWQLQEVILQKVHLSVEKELSILMPWYIESEAKQSCPLGIPSNNQGRVSYLRGAGSILTDRRAWRVVQENQMR